MSRQPMGRAAAFWTAFFATLIVLAAVLAGALLLPELLAGDEQEPPERGSYVPEAADRMNILLSWSEKESGPPDFFVLIAFAPDRGKIAVCMLPENVCIEEGGEETTLGAVYEKGGIRYTQKQLAGFIGTDISRYGETDLKDTEALLSYRGLMEYYLPVDVRYSRGMRTVDMPRGSYQLDGRSLADLLLCTSYSGGQAERTDRGGMLLSQMVSENLPAFLSDEGDRLMARLLDLWDTDISVTDYEQRKQALYFLAALELPAATTVFLDGEELPGGNYRLSEGCVLRLREACGESAGE